MENEIITIRPSDKKLKSKLKKKAKKLKFKSLNAYLDNVLTTEAK